jgi:hypothetical protein
MKERKLSLEAEARPNNIYNFKPYGKENIFFITEVNCLLLFKEMIAVRSENHTRLINIYSVGKIRSLLLKQMVYIFTSGLQRVNYKQCTEYVVHIIGKQRSLNTASWRKVFKSEKLCRPFFPYCR